MKKIILLLRKISYVLSCLFGVFVLFTFFQIPKGIGRIKIIYLGGRPTWNRCRQLYVSNHPSWLDQFIVTCLYMPYWSTNYLPYIVTASDSIKRLSYLRFLSKVYFLVPIERQSKFADLRRHITTLRRILLQDYNLMMAGSSGRDFKKTEEETVYSPQKRKPLRSFSDLCGFLAVLPGVETNIFCIEGTEKFYREKNIDGKKEMKFSWWDFLVNFYIMGKINITIIFAPPLMLQGKHKREATAIIQNTVLSLLDYDKG